MKNLKRVMAVLMTGVMTIGMMGTAFANTTENQNGKGASATYSITIENEKEGHTYEAYQIFKGDLSDAGELSNIVWGDSASSTLNAADIAKQLENGNNDKYEGTDKLSMDEFLDKIGADITLGDPVKSTDTCAEGKYVIDGLSAGYYLVKDQDESLAGATEDAYTKYIVKVVKDVTAVPKSVIPTVDKQVHDEVEDAEANHTEGWGETADHAINESFQFKLTATIPASENLSDYETYKVVFTDTMSKGITFESIESVKINSADVTDYVCTATEGLEGSADWTLTIANIKASLSEDELNHEITVEVIYNAHLNEDAVIGNIDDNKNTVKLDYSNNPNGEGTGTTKEDHVWVFTYDMPNQKVDGDNKPLGGAGFKLYGNKQVDGMDQINEDVEIPVVKVEDAASPLNGSYRLAKEGETGVEMLTDAASEGKFTINGLDTGIYWLKETTTPSGYNDCAPVKIVIGAEHIEGDDKETASTNITMTMNDEASTLNQIVNQKGSVLPETGGIGTTIFYVLGSILVLGAAILLVTKRRMRNEQ